jgi:hypothetical protein
MMEHKQSVCCNIYFNYFYSKSPRGYHSTKNEEARKVLKLMGQEADYEKYEKR